MILSLKRAIFLLLKKGGSLDPQDPNRSCTPALESPDQILATFTVAISKFRLQILDDVAARGLRSRDLETRGFGAKSERQQTHSFLKTI